MELAISLQQDLHLAFRFFQLLATGVGEGHAFIEELECFVQRHVAFFQLVDDDFQALKAIFKLWQYVAPAPILMRLRPDESKNREMVFAW
jgi:hypothetical protein